VRAFAHSTFRPGTVISVRVAWRSRASNCMTSDCFGSREHRGKLAAAVQRRQPAEPSVVVAADVFAANPNGRNRRAPGEPRELRAEGEGFGELRGASGALELHDRIGGAEGTQRLLRRLTIGSSRQREDDYGSRLDQRAELGLRRADVIVASHGAIHGLLRLELRVGNGGGRLFLEQPWALEADDVAHRIPLRGAIARLFDHTVLAVGGSRAVACATSHRSNGSSRRGDECPSAYVDSQRAHTAAARSRHKQPEPPARHTRGQTERP